MEKIIKQLLDRSNFDELYRAGIGNDSYLGVRNALCCYAIAKKWCINNDYTCFEDQFYWQEKLQLVEPIVSKMLEIYTEDANIIASKIDECVKIYPEVKYLLNRIINVLWHTNITLWREIFEKSKTS